jgi:hypothetical protein
VTDHISKTGQTAGYIAATIDKLGAFGVIGRTNRLYLPVLLRETP